MFRRRTTAESDAAPSAAVATEDAVETPAGKGRPTPKRREAEQARKERVRPPRDRREAMKLQRARTKAERAKVQHAMTTGDDRYLPQRDKGPQRKFVRDYIDARRTLAEYLLPFFLLIFVLMMVQVEIVLRAATFLWLVAIVLAPIDLFFLSRKLKAELRTRFPDDSLKGSVAYGMMRATQLRKLRLPKPRLKPGDQVP